MEDIKAEDESPNILKISPQTEINNETKSDSIFERPMTRREFLGLALRTCLAGGALALGLGSKEKDRTQSITETSLTEKVFTPEIIDGVPVYGFNEKIDNLDKVESLYNQLDKEYERTHNIKILDKYKQRKELLNPNERYLEVVVFKSTYESFQRRETETNVTFVEWIKMHVDAMNLCFSNAKPSSDLKAVLRRIIVLEEGTLDPIFDMNQYLQGKASTGPDWPYNLHFVFSEKSPFDTDESWVVGSDYRVNTQENIDNYKGGYFWSCDSIDGKIYFGCPPGTEAKSKIRVYPDYGSSLTGKMGVWMDFGMTHEWLHYLFNLPDEYVYDIHSNGEPKAYISTGSFCEPYLSPYLSILAQNHIKKKLRDYLYDSNERGYITSDIPEEIDLTTDENVEIQAMRTLRVEEGKESYFPSNPDYISTDNSIKTNKSELTKNNAYALQLSLTQNGQEKQLYFPCLAFQMSKLNGKEKAEYKIEILDEIKDTVQHIAIVDKFDMLPLVEEIKRVNHMSPVAKMDIDGTIASYIWFQDIAST